MKGSLARAVVLVGSLMCALALGACVTPSINPIFTEADQPFVEPGLEGVWRKEPDDPTTLTVARVEDGYRMTVKDQSMKKEWEFDMRLVKIGDSKFADLSATRKVRQEVMDKWGPHFVPTHMFFAWRLDKDTLITRELTKEWLDGSTLPHTRLQDGRRLITAESKDLQQVLKDHVRDAAFANETVLHRVKQ